MRLIVTAVSVTILYATSILAGGGTVTSTEPGPPAFTDETAAVMLDTMGIEPATATTADAEQPEGVEDAEPARVEAVNTPPARQSAQEESETEAAETEEQTEIASNEPITPREAVRQCTTCHGLDGIAKIPTAPNMAGSSRGYLETQLKAFRSGRRKHEVMSVIAEALSDEEIKATAKWYSAIKVTAEIPE